MNWFEVIKNQRTLTDTITHVGTKTEDVPEEDKGRCYQKLLAIKDNLLHMAKPENNDLFKDYAEDMQTTETGWVPERKDAGSEDVFDIEDTGPMEEYSRKGQNYAMGKDGEKLYRWVSDSPSNPHQKKIPPRFKMTDITAPKGVKGFIWRLEPPNNLILGNALTQVGEGFSEEHYCVALEKVQEFFDSGKEFIPMGSDKFTVDGEEFKVVATNKHTTLGRVGNTKNAREQSIAIRFERGGKIETLVKFRYVLTWDGLEKRIKMTPKQRPKFVYWVFARRPYWWAKEIFDKIERAAGEIGKWWK